MNYDAEALSVKRSRPPARWSIPIGGRSLSDRDVQEQLKEWVTSGVSVPSIAAALNVGDWAVVTYLKSPRIPVHVGQKVAYMIRNGVAPLPVEGELAEWVQRELDDAMSEKDEAARAPVFDPKYSRADTTYKSRKDSATAVYIRTQLEKYMNKEGLDAYGLAERLSAAWKVPLTQALYDWTCIAIRYGATPHIKLFVPLLDFLGYDCSQGCPTMKNGNKYSHVLKDLFHDGVRDWKNRVSAEDYFEEVLCDG